MTHRTISLPHQISIDDLNLIESFQREQSSMTRCSHVQFLKGKNEKEVRGVTTSRFAASQLDSWFVQSSVKNASWMIAADKEKGIEKRVFGGRKNLERRNKGLISNEEWKKLKLQPLISIGEAQRKGNRKFDFIDTSKVIFKPYKGKKIEIKLPKLKRKLKNKLEFAFKLANENKIAITVQLDQHNIYFAFDTAILKHYSDTTKQKPIKNRYAGIDINPNYVGVSVFDDEKLVCWKLFDLKDLTGKHKSENKILHETREVAHEIGRYLESHHVDHLFLEELSFKTGDSGNGKSFNRLTKNQWKRNKFIEVLENYFKIYKVNPAYSSVIGNILNPSLPDPVAASVEIGRRGFNLIVLKNKKFYPEIPSQEYINSLWKDCSILDVTNWKELLCLLKNMEVRYRVPVPQRTVFKKFKSSKSKVFVIDNFRYN